MQRNGNRTVLKGLGQRARSDEGGFTLIELLVASVVIGILFSAIGGAIMLWFGTSQATTNRLALSHDSQLVSAYLIPDLTNGPSTLTTQSAGALCPSSFSELTLTWNDAATGTPYKTDYTVAPTSSGAVMSRTVTVNGVAQPSVTVVHNLKSTCGAVLTTSGSARTLTLTTSLNGTDYTFSVTGSPRVG
jgi:prepilin-type N-terminal cleavage/methylation domain-containing protein